MASTLTSNGRVTIPKKIRDALDLQPGCKLDVVMNNSGALLIKIVAPNSQKPSRNCFVKLKKNNSKRSKKLINFNKIKLKINNIKLSKKLFKLYKMKLKKIKIKLSKKMLIFNKMMIIKYFFIFLIGYNK